MSDRALSQAALGDAAASYLTQIAGQVKATSPHAIANRIRGLVGEHDAWRGDRSLNMNPAEGLMSRSCRSVLASDMATRLTEGVPGAKLYPHGPLNDHIDEIEATIIALTQQLFGARHVEWRPVSTTMANALVFFSTLKPGDVVLSQDEDGGGNYVYHSNGPVALTGARAVPLACHGEAFEIDLSKAAEKARALRPKLIVIGGSNVLFPYPLRELREIADSVGALLVYDAAHLGLLISRGQFQRPLEEGAHVVTISTHKIMGGPVGGMVLTNDPGIAQDVARLAFPGFMQTRDLNKYAALGIALSEVAAFGGELADQMVRNAQALGAALAAEGFALVAPERGFTATHQLFLKLGAQAAAFERRCHGANIFLADCALAGDSKVSQRNGARLATHELTRLGMEEAEMVEIASLIARAHRGTCDDLGAEVARLRDRFPRIAFSFDDA